MIQAQWSGGPELERALMALDEAVRKPVVVQALTEAAEPMRADMQRNAPRSKDAPHVQENIIIAEATSLEGVRVSDTEAAIAIGPAKKRGRVDFFYSLFIEFGTIKMPARPFVRPAWDGGVSKALASIGELFWAAVRRAAGQ